MMNHIRGLHFLVLLCFTGVTTAQIQTYTFTAAGQTGSVGPSQTQVNTSYAGTNLSGSVTVTGGIQSFVVPVSGFYRISMAAASGGTPANYPSNVGGLGAKVEGDFYLNSGDVLQILVGQRGGNGTGGSGGGGGTFLTCNNTLLIAAGGGGGATSDNSAAHGTTLTAGTNDFPGGNTPGGSNGTGGSACNVAGANHGGAGGGYLTDGATSTAPTPGGGGMAFVNGGTGGAGGTAGAWGGFGGGGGATQITVGGGGGGGYSGGAGGQQVNYCTSGIGRSGGGGGGSYNSGINQVNIEAANYGDGYVTITSLCDVEVAASKNPICFGETITLSTNAGSSILWSTGATTDSINVAPASNTTYTVSGVSQSTSACSSTLVITVTVNPLPQVTASGIPSVVCAGNNATLMAGGASTFSWSNSVSHYSTTVAPLVNSVYTVTGTDGNNCSSDATVQVQVSTYSLTVTPSFSLCEGVTTTLSASGGLPGSYFWANLAPFPSIVVTPTSNMVYNVTALDVNNCPMSGSVAVTLWSNPVATLGADRDMICLGESVVLTAGGGGNYHFSTGQSGSANEVTVTPGVDIIYVYSVSVTDLNGCSATATTMISVDRCSGLSDNAKPIATVWPNPGHGAFNVAFTVPGEKQVTVIDLQGRVLYSTVTAETVMTVDISEFAPGVYYLQVHAPQGVSSTKIIRN